ncbi:MNIO family bufferin maturase [Pseudogulbenkiania subflava]|uniref:UPF0276 protein SAMN02745746_02023 n=1 Tax=Pseudogulbenkiania subflava DSM 22618 TaxID=1123014 RepID=A0A1Y6C1Z3_9NEIS|nr:DUF692 domain-containing protein [Pseudogulbenkiania subflava]SMF23150.1 hypothetical protein SAMN02745746_02023 [Pseudogulbenkiania subflava DSM 22618]SMF32493.1 hypothetical protein SAMN02745746_02571 [Pseudogulbenkiania subflava DSM 22618]SMF47581.1 hypothetical protein SAMN02745746_03500 [Pseudogulbenkiania subflava DSM 22618]
MLAATLPNTEIPAHAGIGLRPIHFAQVLAERPSVPWFEVHSENFFGAGGELLSVLEGVRRDYPISLHGVGLHLGSASGLQHDHLAKLGRLVDHIDPGQVSEHLCWGAVDGHSLNELLPLPYTEEALDLMIECVLETQEFLGRQILIENVSSYLSYRHSTIPEWEFLVALAERSGCGLLFDVNNVYVNSVNHGFDPQEYLHAIPAHAVGEMHLAGFSRKEGLPVPLLIDTHSRRVDAAVWALYREAVRLLGAKPTLIEWDQDLPAFAVLQDEARLAEEILRDYRPVLA